MAPAFLTASLLNLLSSATLRRILVIQASISLMFAFPPTACKIASAFFSTSSTFCFFGASVTRSASTALFSTDIFSSKSYCSKRPGVGILSFLNK